ncbi:sensor histidine kinase [Actinophytocola xanthii]|uniref:histidine kinase n=1 Tax=Actinophytocola xanthii TaxID=1912961 RepID=A0A1Q8CUR2_9PSEU|nr:histidine kinase [Actinophytocola xanthii]OLF18054.1 hypothetical protein BU204_07860 [Actinophytocola xanthii]
MGRHRTAPLLVLAVVPGDVLLFIATHEPLAALAYGPAALLVAASADRAPKTAFTATLALAVLSGGSYPLLVWVSHRAGLATSSRRDTAVVAGAVAGWAGVAFTVDPGPQTVGICVVFVVLPLLVGRYLSQQRRLVEALAARNHQLRRERELLAEREQLRERLRIARDVHDSLGHRLSLVSVQAAALEVAALPEPHGRAVASLAAATRAAVTELHELVGSLRGSGGDRVPGLAATDAVAAGFRAAGLPVTVETRGEPRPLPPAADAAAYHVVVEGLTNAAKHAPGCPVTVRLGWEPDALVLSVTNPVPGHAAAGRSGAGLGLVGLRERVEPAGGFLDHRAGDGEFRVVAMLPVAPPADDGPGLEAEAGIGRVRALALGAAVAALVFFVLPASMLTGVA